MSGLKLFKGWNAQTLRTYFLVSGDAPDHVEIESVLEREEFRDCKILRLGLYSRMLYPIESIWSTIKSDVKSNCNRDKQYFKFLFKGFNYQRIEA